MNIRKITRKLQMALCQQGRYIRINQKQFYSATAERMVTKYVLIETRENETGRKKDHTLLETYRPEEVAKKLAAIYGGEE